MYNAPDMSQGDEPTTPTLEYRHRPRLSVIGRHKKKLILLALCLSIGVPLYRNWGSLKHRILWHYWFRQALAYQMPGKAVDLRIHDTTRAADAMDRDRAYRQSSSNGTGRSVEYAPIPYLRLREMDSRLAVNSWTTSPVAFIGEMVRPDGTRRLVIINTKTYSIASRFLDGTSVQVLPIPGWADPLPPIRSNLNGIDVGGGDAELFPSEITYASLRSGMLDPADRAHLIFEYVVGPTAPLFGPNLAPFSTTSPFPKVDWDQVQASGIIDARLQNDDSLHFSLRQDPDQPQRIQFGTSPILKNVAPLR